MNFDEFIYLYKKGAQLNAYDFFGAHISENGVVFRVYAPNASAVSVVGDFNSWNVHANAMQRKDDVFILEIEGSRQGDVYKYAVTDAEGRTVLKADPYAFWSELRPNNASRVFDPYNYKFNDDEWINKRREWDFTSKPINIYEVSLTSFTQSCKDYEQIDLNKVGSDIISHVKDMNYTHIEIMPVTEYPLDMSWGYQVTGYFCPTSRLGSPKELQNFIDLCHQNDIGVIMDWVPGHFCPDEHGLFNFDSSPLYGFKKQPQWGTFKFDFGSHHVWSFLLSSAMYFARLFHIDGIRVDAVTSMLQYNFGHYDQAPEFDNYAKEFLQEYNTIMHKHFEGFLSIAEESSDYLGVTRQVHEGGLGFDMKWDMGWMNDTLKYFEQDFEARRGVKSHQILTFSSTYRQREQYILPFSHDEVVHEKNSMVNKLPGDYWQQFAGYRSLLAYQYFTQGKKLNFMGNEIAQMIEWRYYEPIEFQLLKFPMHIGFRDYVKALNTFYRQSSQLHELDFDNTGFEWIDADNNAQNILSFIRRNKKGDEFIIILNLSYEHHDNFAQGVTKDGFYKEVFNSDLNKFGGSGHTNQGEIKAQNRPWQRRDYSVNIKLPSFSAVVLQRIND